MTGVYETIQKRTSGDIYIGVVGPVRSGKSTFIKKFMECLVIPNITDADRKMQAIDELPQSAAGRTIMTTQPNFIPQQRAQITVGENQNLKVRLVDCVGYMIKGAQGDTEDGKPRMVKTPWHKQAIPFDKAAEIGTEKVITDHSTIGIVVTTDGSITDIPRENYQDAEEKAINQLKAIGKPFVVVVNTITPKSQIVAAIVASISQKFAVPAVRINCLELDKNKIEEILTLVLTQFNVREISFTIPKWMMMQTGSFLPKEKVVENILKTFEKVKKVSDISKAVDFFGTTEYISDAICENIDYGAGSVVVRTHIEKDLYYDTLQEITGTDVKDDWALMQLMQSLMYAKQQYDNLAPALQQVETTGYGIVMPTLEQLQLQQPQMFKQGSKYGIKFSATAPSLHIIKADISTTVSPILGNDSSGEEMVLSLLANYENNPIEIWQSNLLGNSPQELVNQGLNTKLANLPQDAREKLAFAVEKVVNEGCQGLICIIL